MINISQKPERPNRRSPLSQRVHFSSNALIAVLIILIVVISMFYLVEFNKISTIGIQIDESKDIRDKFIIENEVWSMRIANLKSLDVIQNQDVINRMVNITDVEFLEDI